MLDLHSMHVIRVLIMFKYCLKYETTSLNVLVSFYTFFLRLPSNLSYFQKLDSPIGVTEGEQLNIQKGENVLFLGL